MKKEKVASTSDSRENPANPSDGEPVRYVPRGLINNTDRAAGIGLKMENIGHVVIRYGVVIAVAWVGALKYTDYEEKGIEGLLVNSPLFSWAYHLMGLKTLCAVIGTSELIIAALLAVRYFAPKVSVLGGIGAIGMFLTTLSFLFTTPGTLMPQGFPFLSGDVGEFLIKDVALLGAAIWMTGDSLRAGFSKRKTECHRSSP
jgi:reactive chlorine resistance protein C